MHEDLSGSNATTELLQITCTMMKSMENGSDHMLHTCEALAKRFANECLFIVKEGQHKERNQDSGPIQ